MTEISFTVFGLLERLNWLIFNSLNLESDNLLDYYIKAKENLKLKKTLEASLVYSIPRPITIIVLSNDLSVVFPGTASIFI